MLSTASWLIGNLEFWRAWRRVGVLRVKHPGPRLIEGPAVALRSTFAGDTAILGCCNILLW